MSSRERHLTQARAEHLLRSAKLAREHDHHIAAARFISFAKDIMDNRRVVDKNKLDTMLQEYENAPSSPIV